METIWRGTTFPEHSTLTVHQKVVKACKNYWKVNNQTPNVVLVGEKTLQQTHPAYKLTFPDGSVSIITPELHPVAGQDQTILAGFREEEGW